MTAMETVYNDTVDRLRGLNMNQLIAVRSFVVELGDEGQFVSPLGVETEEQLWEHIDYSLSQAKAGEGRDADEVIESHLDIPPM